MNNKIAYCISTNGSHYELVLDLKELCIKLALLEKRGELNFVVIRKVSGFERCLLHSPKGQEKVNENG
jgi:hypothetical protein